MRALDLFCCAGGASDGLTRAGFEVDGVDLEAQPEYPYVFLRHDVLAMPHGIVRAYDFVWASPPCQPESA